MWFSAWAVFFLLHVLIALLHLLTFFILFLWFIFIPILTACYLLSSLPFVVCISHNLWWHYFTCLYSFCCCFYGSCFSPFQIFSPPFDVSTLHDLWCNSVGTQWADCVISSQQPPSTSLCSLTQNGFSILH